MRYVHRDRYAVHGFAPAAEPIDLICPVCGWLIRDNEEIIWRGDDACHKDCIEEDEDG